MQHYRLSYRKGHWILTNDETGLVQTVFFNKPKIESLILAHAEVADKTGTLTVCKTTGQVEEVINLPCQDLPVNQKGKRRYRHTAVLKPNKEVENSGDGV